LQSHASGSFAKEFAEKSLEYTANLLGFSYTIVEYHEDKWHGDAAAWNATGMLAETNSILWFEKRDSVAELYPAQSNCTACGFGKDEVTIYEDAYTLITTMDKRTPGLWGFLEPISTHVWLTLTLSAAVFAIVFFLVELQGTAGRPRGEPGHQTKSSKSAPQLNASIGGLFHSVYFAFTSFFSFGDYTPHTVLGRLLVCAWSFLVTIMVATYTANVSTLCHYLSVTISLQYTLALSHYCAHTIALTLLLSL
jgi:hypothetical protein